MATGPPELHDALVHATHRQRSPQAKVIGDEVPNLIVRVECLVIEHYRGELGHDEDVFG